VGPKLRSVGVWIKRVPVRGRGLGPKATENRPRDLRPGRRNRTKIDPETLSGDPGASRTSRGTVPRSMQMSRCGQDGVKARLSQSQNVEIGRNTKDRQRFGSKEFLTEKGGSETEIGRGLDQKSSC